MTKSKLVCFRVAQAELSRLDEIAILTNRTRSGVVRQLIKRAHVVPEQLTALELHKVRKGTTSECYGAVDSQSDQKQEKEGNQGYGR